MDNHLHLDQVTYNQLEKQCFQLKSSLKQESLRRERLNSQYDLTRSQIIIFTEEAQKLKKSLKKSSEALSADIFAELRSIKTPVSSLCDICSSFLLILDIKNRSWSSFRSLTKHYLSFKKLIDGVNPDALKESVVNEVLPLWKSQKHLKSKLGKSAAGTAILDWIGLIVEVNLKNEIVKSSQKRVPELEKKIRKQQKLIEELELENTNLERMLAQAKTTMKFREFEFDDCSETSMNSKMHNFYKPANRQRNVITTTVQKGTASGGIMQKVSRMPTQRSEPLFPNFNSDTLYGEIPVYKHTEIDEQIIYEGRTEMIGCCRMRFFCF